MENVFSAHYREKVYYAAWRGNDAHSSGSIVGLSRYLYPSGTVAFSLLYKRSLPIWMISSFDFWWPDHDAPRFILTLGYLEMLQLSSPFWEMIRFLYERYFVFWLLQNYILYPNRNLMVWIIYEYRWLSGKELTLYVKGISFEYYN